MKASSPTPDAILQTAFGFWNSKVLLTAVTFDLFSTLGQQRLTGAEIGKKLDLHPRGIADFLDAPSGMAASMPSSISRFDFSYGGAVAFPGALQTSSITRHD